MVVDCSVAETPSAACVQPYEAAAQDGAGRGWALALYRAAWVDTTLLDFPGELVGGDLEFEETRLTALIASRPITEVSVPVLGTRRRVDGVRLEFEAQAIRHDGLQDHWEVVAAVVVRSPEIGLPTGTTIDFALGNGLSYALSDPVHEEGRGGRRGVDTVRLQYNVSSELQLKHRSRPRLGLFMRVHHRSGVFGVFSPPRTTGSNHFGVGVRFNP